jgi:regulator of sigma E protease
MMGDDENPLEGGKTGTVDPKRAFNVKPLAVRFLIVFAGPAMNFVLAVVIFTLVFMILGRPVAPALIGRVVENGPVAQAGLKTGDRITAIDGRPVSTGKTCSGPSRTVGRQAHAHGASRAYGRAQSRRHAGSDERAISSATSARRGTSGRGPTCRRRSATSSRFPPRSGLTPETSSFPSRKPVCLGRLAEIQRRHSRPASRSARRDVQVSVVPTAVKERGPAGKEIEDGRIAISPAAGFSFVRSNPFQALREGIDRTVEVTALTAVGLYKIVVGQLDRKNIGGPIQIAVTAGEQARQGVASLAFFTAVISINLFLLNLLPVPMLDGGHLLFFVFEAVLGRPLSLRKREVAQQVGFGLLMLLMVYAVYNDLDRIGLFSFFR